MGYDIHFMCPRNTIWEGIIALILLCILFHGAALIILRSTGERHMHLGQAGRRYRRYEGKLPKTNEEPTMIVYPA